MATYTTEGSWGPPMAERYQIVSPLNNGSFGLISLARDTVTGQAVALKSLASPLLDSETHRRSLTSDSSDELATHVRLGSHPHIVQLIGSFQTQTHRWLVLEYCSMGDLYEAIQAQRIPLSTEHIRRLMLQLVDGVAHMHECGIFHRDLKPENIFLNAAGDLKIGDFGLATTVRYAYDACVGSDRYMAPEQYDSEGAGYDTAKADIWAVGICLLNILFSRNPFAAPTASDPLFVDFVRDRKSLFDVFPSMSEATFEALRQCLDVDPRRRSLAGLRVTLQRVDSFVSPPNLRHDHALNHSSYGSGSSQERMQPIPVLTEDFRDCLAGLRDPRDRRESAESLEDAVPTEIDNEDLFEDMAKSNVQDQASDAVTPSLSSVWDSSFGSSYKSLVLEDAYRESRGQPIVPLSVIEPVISPCSRSFNHKGCGPRSWSKRWDEEDDDTDVQLAVQTSVRRGGSLRAKALGKPRSLDCLRERATSGHPPREPRSYRHPIIRKLAQPGNGRSSADTRQFRLLDDAENPLHTNPLHSHLSTRQKSMTNADIMAKWEDLGDRRRALDTGREQSHDQWEADRRSCDGDGGRSWRAALVNWVASEPAADADHEQRVECDDAGWELDYEWVGGWHDLHL